VRRRLPVTVAAVSGSLETGTLPEAEPALRECLAMMPAALVIDGPHLKIAPSAHLWLLGLAQSAARWPGTPVFVTGEHPELPEGDLISSYATLREAMTALASPAFPERRQLTVPPDPRSCARGRALVAQACEEWNLRRPRRLAELLVSELVANVVMHAGTQMTITVRKTGADLEVSVRDHGTGKLPPEQEMSDPRGFGLQLVAALSESWGWSPAGRGKVVWSRVQGLA
jgi:anti-sigma regulatory factor (Ser/Thr protein kinase)